MYKAYHEGSLSSSPKKCTGKMGRVFLFIRRSFTFVCPTELEDLANKYSDFQAAGYEVFGFLRHHFVHRRGSMTPQI